MEKDKGKGGERVEQEFVKGGKRQKVDEVHPRSMPEDQISNYFEKGTKEARKVDVVDAPEEDGSEYGDEVVLVTPMRDSLSDEKAVAVHGRMVSNAEVAVPPPASMGGQQKTSDLTKAVSQVNKKDAATQIDIKLSAKTPEPQQDPVVTVLTQAQQWVEDILTDPQPVDTNHTNPLDEAREPVKPNADQLQSTSIPQPIQTTPNSTDRLISYAESLLPGAESHPQHVIFSMDNDGTPSVWGNSYNPFNLPPEREIDAQTSNEQLMECYMYPVMDDEDQLRYITGPKPDLRRNQVWKYGLPIHDETLYKCYPRSYFRESVPREGEFRGGKPGEIDLRERIPLIRDSSTSTKRYASAPRELICSRPTTRYAPENLRLTSQIQSIHKNASARRKQRRSSHSRGSRSRQNRHPPGLDVLSEQAGYGQTVQTTDIHEEFAELERQMLEEEDRGCRDDWDDLMWTLSDDEMDDMELMGASMVAEGDILQNSNKRTISEEEKEHWKNLDRRV